MANNNIDHIMKQIKIILFLLLFCNISFSQNISKGIDTTKSLSNDYLLKNLTEYKWTALVANPKGTAYVSITWILDKNGTKKISIFVQNSLEEVIKHVKSLNQKDFKNLSGAYISPKDLSKGTLHSINLLNKPEEIKELSDSLLVIKSPSGDGRDDSTNYFYIREDYLSDISFVKRHLTKVPKDSVRRIR